MRTKKKTLMSQETEISQQLWDRKIFCEVTNFVRMTVQCDLKEAKNSRKLEEKKEKIGNPSHNGLMQYCKS